MAPRITETRLSVVFHAERKDLSRKTPADHWFVLKPAEDPRERWIATYANLVGRRDLFRKMATMQTQTIIEGLDRGLPIATMDKVRILIGLSRGQMSGLLDVSPRTLSRRQGLKSGASERLFRLSALFHKVLEVMGDCDEARRWFSTPKKALGGKTPLELAETEIGAREVEDLLGRIEHGVYS